MTAVDGDPLTGDPTGPDVRHLLAIVRPAIRPTPRPVPVIHEPCGLGQCGGCTASRCRTRANSTGPVPVETPRKLGPEQALTGHGYWYDSDHIEGNGS